MSSSSFRLNDRLAHGPVHSAPFTNYAQAASLKSLSLTVNALTAVTDVAIALVLCYLLQQSRTGFKRSDTLITKLIIFTVCPAS